MNHVLDEGSGAGESAAVGGFKFAKLFDKDLNPAAAALLQDSGSLRGGVETDGAAIIRVGATARQELSFKGDDDAGHRWRFDLLGGGEFRKRKRPGKD